jgi:protein-disulfide isomerase
MEKPAKKNISLIIFGLLILICAVAVYLANPPQSANKNASLPATIDRQNTPKIPIEGEFWTGSDNPKITIVEFADFGCSYCKQSHSTIRQLGFKYKDSVKIVFKDYPIREDSIDLAIAARCAGEQGFFWAMHDKLFAYQGKFAVTDLAAIAAEIGVERKAFAACLTDDKHQALIHQNLTLGESLGVSGTPTFFINGYMVTGDKPMEYWEQLIDLILNKQE